jgi:hypothetical protein
VNRCMLLAAFLFDPFRTPPTGTPDNGGMQLTPGMVRRIDVYMTRFGQVTKERYA